ncbi:hypothetical protein OG858_47070 (plasmid) [Streptomyces europaeiscabiei]|uniref:hypothetical protein n=1 Tax=Streptomyces europaeiscabiei TaxID=146819 RepID=UPI002E80C0D2|nr:hypothetical protein [Streptomyces europaeiscabiei]WUD38870.1 hypothetical protein OG858_47070 [Streptomyces europaeiscabiei]
MTETSPQADTTPDPPHPYTPAALARLMLSDAYRNVAETALGRIGTEDDSSSTVTPGGFVREAAELIRLAEHAQRQAVIYERERGTSWEEIGEALGITRQSAHTKFTDPVKAWRAPLDKPERRHPDGTPDDKRIPYGARYAPGSAVPANGSAEKTARDLDRWLRRHDGWADQEHPVSGGLPRHSTIEMVLLVGDAAHRMRMDHLVPDPQAEADLLDLRADLQERMLRESERGGDPLPRGFHQSLVGDRARAKALRAAPGDDSAWEEAANAYRTAMQQEA